MRYCKACGSLNWEGSTSCTVCSSNSLSEDGANIGQIGLSSAFVLIYAIKPTALHGFRILASVLQDIDPSVTEDALMMSAIQRTLPLTGSLEKGVLERGHIRQSLEEGRFSYPEEMIDELLEAYESIKVLAVGGPHELVDHYQQLQARRANLSRQDGDHNFAGVSVFDTLAVAREMRERRGQKQSEANSAFVVETPLKVGAMAGGVIFTAVVLYLDCLRGKLFDYGLWDAASNLFCLAYSSYLLFCFLLVIVWVVKALPEYPPRRIPSVAIVAGCATAVASCVTYTRDAWVIINLLSYTPLIALAIAVIWGNGIETCKKTTSVISIK